MTALALLADLERQGVRLRIEGDRVRVAGPSSVPSGPVIERLRPVKAAILEAIAGKPVCPECGAIIIREPKAWWGGVAVHASCGEAAWQREWGKVPADRRCADDTADGVAA